MQIQASEDATFEVYAFEADIGDMADEIFVINIGVYIGESTRREIAYAENTGKKVNYLEPAE